MATKGVPVFLYHNSCIKVTLSLATNSISVKAMCRCRHLYHGWSQQ